MIEPIVTAFALTLARVGTFIQVLPLLGGANVPRTIKIGLAMSLAVFFFDFGATPSAGFGSTAWLALLMALGREVMLGGLLGFAFSLLLAPARIAGDFVAQECGLTFGNIVSAAGDGSSNPFAVLFEMLASLLFFALDLHHYFLLTLHATFHSFPIGQCYLLPSWDFVAATSAVEQGGLLLAAPLALCLFLTTIVLALLTRAAPQLNLYSVGFPLRVLVCVGAIVLFLPHLLQGIVGLFAHFLDFLQLRG